MSAVPESRAGAGSAMNDATRELGAALGVAVLGSIAASQYSSHLHDALDKIPGGRTRHRELVDRRRAAGRREAPAARRSLRSPPRRRPRSSTASTSRRCSVSSLAIVAALVTRQFLPRTVADVGPMHSAVEALENAAEFGLGGAMPVFPDEPTHPSPGASAAPARHDARRAAYAPTGVTATSDRARRRAAHPRELRHRRHDGVR